MIYAWHNRENRGLNCMEGERVYSLEDLLCTFSLLYSKYFLFILRHLCKDNAYTFTPDGTPERYLNPKGEVRSVNTLKAVQNQMHKSQCDFAHIGIQLYPAS